MHSLQFHILHWPWC